MKQYAVRIIWALDDLRTCSRIMWVIWYCNQFMYAGRAGAQQPSTTAVRKKPFPGLWAAKRLVRGGQKVLVGWRAAADVGARQKRLTIVP